MKFRSILTLLVLLITGLVFSLAAKQPELVDTKSVIHSPMIGADQTCNSNCHGVVETTPDKSVTTTSEHIVFSLTRQSLDNKIMIAKTSTLIVAKEPFKFRKFGGAFSGYTGPNIFS